MGRRRQRLDWHWNDQRQEFTTPSGRVVSLHEIARLLADQAECRFDFTGPWAGWRMRGAALYPPHTTRGGPCLKPDTGRHLCRWIADASAGTGPRKQLADRQGLRLVYSSTLRP